MNDLERLWRERIDWVQASGLTIAAASAEPGMSAASVYRWKKLLAESRVRGWRWIRDLVQADR
jgi:transposase